MGKGWIEKTEAEAVAVGFGELYVLDRDVCCVCYCVGGGRHSCHLVRSKSDEVAIEIEKGG